MVYDWRVFTLQELLRSVKKVLANSKVLSIAVVAPGSKPGCVGACPCLKQGACRLGFCWVLRAGCVLPRGGARGHTRKDLCFLSVLPR